MQASEGFAYFHILMKITASQTEKLQTSILRLLSGMISLGVDLDLLSELKTKNQEPNMEE